MDSRTLFRHRCEARALLWQADYFTLHAATDGLLPVALALGLTDADEITLIMGAAFAAVRDDLDGWRP